MSKSSRKEKDWPDDRSEMSQMTGAESNINDDDDGVVDVELPEYGKNCFTKF